MNLSISKTILTSLMKSIFILLGDAIHSKQWQWNVFGIDFFDEKACMLVYVQCITYVVVYTEDVIWWKNLGFLVKFWSFHNKCDLFHYLWMGLYRSKVVMETTTNISFNRKTNCNAHVNWTSKMTKMQLKIIFGKIVNSTLQDRLREDFWNANRFNRYFKPIFTLLNLEIDCIFRDFFFSNFFSNRNTDLKLLNINEF